MRQARNPDASYQAPVNRHALEQLVHGLPPCSASASAGALCKTRKPLTLALIGSLVRQTRFLAAKRTPEKVAMNGMDGPSNYWMAPP